MRSYRRLGLMGLVDAPRTGRPLVADRSPLVASARRSSARATALAIGISPDVVWRHARLQGLSIERSSGRTHPVPICASLPRIVGAYIDSATSVVLTASHEAIENGTSPMGYCYSTERRRVLDAESVGSKDWRESLRDLRARSGVAPERARSEAKTWLAMRASKLVAAGCELTVLIGGVPTSRDFVRWLSTFRASIELGRVKFPNLRHRCATTLVDWSHLLVQQGCRSGTDDGLLWPATDARPFAWCRSVRSALCDLPLSS